MDLFDQSTSNQIRRGWLDVFPNYAPTYTAHKGQRIDLWVRLNALVR